MMAAITSGGVIHLDVWHVKCVRTQDWKLQLWTQELGRIKTEGKTKKRPDCWVVLAERWVKDSRSDKKLKSQTDSGDAPADSQLSKERVNRERWSLGGYVDFTYLVSVRNSQTHDSALNPCTQVEGYFQKQIIPLFIFWNIFFFHTSRVRKK